MLVFLKPSNYSVSEPFNLQNQVQLDLNGQNVLLSKAVSKIIIRKFEIETLLHPQLNSSRFEKNIQPTTSCCLGYKITRISI